MESCCLYSYKFNYSAMWFSKDFNVISTKINQSKNSVLIVKVKAIHTTRVIFHCAGLGAKQVLTTKQHDRFESRVDVGSHVVCAKVLCHATAPLVVRSVTNYTTINKPSLEIPWSISQYFKNKYFPKSERWFRGYGSREIRDGQMHVQHVDLDNATS